MKTKILKLFSISLLYLFVGTGCEQDDKLSPYSARGKIIEITALCYGEVVLIEVENPKNIGALGKLIGNNGEELSYENAIGVPYFAKIGIPDSIQIIGSYLDFEYRELTEEEKKQDLFSSTVPIICHQDIIPPKANRLIITKIFSYK